jgi:hypothetical protein
MKRTVTTRSVEISIERSDFTALKSARASIQLPCPQCGQVTKFVKPEVAARVAQTTLRSIFRGLDMGEIHFLEMAGGWLLVCLNSLAVFNRG